MAKHYIGVNLGAGLSRAPTTGTSTGNTDVELVITDAVTGVAGSKVAVLKAIDALKAYIQTSNAPV